jgi:hypothetical protein
MGQVDTMTPNMVNPQQKEKEHPENNTLIA